MPSSLCESFPPTPTFSLHADSPLLLTHSIFRFVNTTEKAQAELCWFPVPGLEDILPFGCPAPILGVWVGLLSFSSLVLRFGYILEASGKSERILMPGSHSQKFWFNGYGVQSGHWALLNLPKIRSQNLGLLESWHSKKRALNLNQLWESLI